MKRFSLLPSLRVFEEPLCQQASSMLPPLLELSHWERLQALCLLLPDALIKTQVCVYCSASERERDTYALQSECESPLKCVNRKHYRSRKWTAEGAGVTNSISVTLTSKMETSHSAAMVLILKATHTPSQTKMKCCTVQCLKADQHKQKHAPALFLINSVQESKIRQQGAHHVLSRELLQ